MQIVEELRSRYSGNAKDLTLINRLVSGLRTARAGGQFKFVPLLEIADMAPTDAPLFADVLSSLIKEGCAERRVAVRIPEHGIEVAYSSFLEIPDTVKAKNGEPISITDEHVHPEYRATTHLLQFKGLSGRA